MKPAIATSKAGGPACESWSAAPRAAYVHVPFCKHRCGYCNFTLVAGRDDLIQPYLAALGRELAGLGEPHEVDTLFFGGGTPTHLPAAELRELFETVMHWFPLAPGYELSIEANPLDLTKELTSVLQCAGVTRISLGGQSFDERKLQQLERDHSPADVCRAIELARGAARSVSLDLIFGVPGETASVWQGDLARALDQGVDHVSTYGLTFEKGAAFWARQSKGAIEQMPDELERALYERAIDALTAAGLEHYEVSNFARPGHRCRHNETYWLGEPYFAVGPGAASYIGGRRQMNHRSTTTYIRRLLAGESPVADSETLSAEDRARELLVFGLRRLEGVDLEAFGERHGVVVRDLIGRSLEEFIARDLLTLEAGRLRLTRAGLLVSDAIWPYFLRA